MQWGDYSCRTEARLLSQSWTQVLSSKLCSWRSFLYFSSSSIPYHHNFLQESWHTGSLCSSTETVPSPMLWGGELMLQVPRLHKFICCSSRASFFSLLLCHFKELMRILAVRGPSFTSAPSGSHSPYRASFQILQHGGKSHRTLVMLLLSLPMPTP